MANLNTTQLANSFLGPPKRFYHQVLITHANQPHLKIDKLNAGDFRSVDSGVLNSNPVYEYTGKDGLLLTFDRPQNAAGNMGVWAAVNLKNLELPTPFLLIGTFCKPNLVLQNQQSVLGTYAASILLNSNNNLMGVTAQFRDTGGVRMNLPGTGVQPNRQIIPDSLYNDIMRSQDPSPFTLVLYVKRDASGANGNALFYVQDIVADSYSFNFQNGLTSLTIIDDVRIGLGTASGSEYKASLFILEFEIWGPTH